MKYCGYVVQSSVYRCCLGMIVETEILSTTCNNIEALIKQYVRQGELLCILVLLPGAAIQMEVCAISEGCNVALCTEENGIALALNTCLLNCLNDEIS